MKTLKIKPLGRLMLCGLLLFTTTSAVLAEGGECHCYDNATPVQSTVTVPLPPPAPPAIDYSETYTPPAAVEVLDQSTRSSPASEQTSSEQTRGSGQVESRSLPQKPLVVSTMLRMQVAISSTLENRVSLDRTPKFQNALDAHRGLRTSFASSVLIPDSPASDGLSPNSPAPPPPAQNGGKKVIDVGGKKPTGQKKLVISVKNACATDPVVGTAQASGTGADQAVITVSITGGGSQSGTKSVDFTLHPQGTGTLTITATAPGFPNATYQVGGGVHTNVVVTKFPASEEASYEKELKDLCKGKLAAFVGGGSVEFTAKTSYETADCCVNGQPVPHGYAKGSLSGEVKVSGNIPIPLPLSGHVDGAKFKVAGFEISGSIDFGLIPSVNASVGGSVTYEKTCEEKTGCLDLSGSLASGIGFGIGVTGHLEAKLPGGAPHTLTGKLETAKLSAGVKGSIHHNTCDSKTEGTLCFLPINLNLNPNITLTADGVAFLHAKLPALGELNFVFWKGTCGAGGGE